MSRKLSLHPIDKEAVALAVPALGALIAEPLYVLADTAVVGRIGTAELGGLGLASQVIATVISVSIFLAYGTTSAVSRLLGAKRSYDAARWAVQSIWVAVTFGLIMATACFWAAPMLMSWLRATPDVATFGIRYLQIAVWGFPAMLTMLAGVGYLRGTQDTVRPLVVSIATAITNLVLESVLVFRFGYGIGASALSTVLVQYCGAFAYLYWINREVSSAGVGWLPDFKILRTLGIEGFDLLLRTSALRATHLVGASVAATFGAVALGSHEIAIQVFALFALALDALAIAAQAMIGTRIGAKAIDDVFAVTKRLTLWCLAVSTLFSLFALIARDHIGRIFTTDMAVLETLPPIWLAVCVIIPISSIAFTFDGVLIGAGDMRFLAVSMAISAAVYFATLWTSQHFGAGLLGVWYSSIAMMSSRVILLGHRIKYGNWLKA